MKVMRGVHALFVLGIISSLSMASSVANPFTMKRIGVVAGAQSMSSTSFENSAVAAQSSPTGAASQCNQGFRTTLGFWSVEGNLPVPIMLNARLNTIDPNAVDLAWSGSAEMFQVFSDSAPDEVADPVNLDQETFLCDATDTQAFLSPIIYYIVLEKP